jgi:hypothetical protein
MRFVSEMAQVTDNQIPVDGDNSDDENDSITDDVIITRPVGPLINVPAKNDVICGRGKSVAHPGNQRFRSIILGRKEDYKKANRRDLKTQITLEIVSELRQGPDPAR